MSMPALRAHHWTVEEVDRLVEERPGYTPRYELVDGELLVTPSPAKRHQRLIGDLYMLLRPYVDQQRVGEVIFSPSTVRLTTDSRVEPDIFVIPAVFGRRQAATVPITNLSLAVEVLSPSSARYDRITKRRFYQRAGVPQYWIVDGEACLFEIWHPDDERPLIVDGAFDWQPDGAREALRIDVARLFASVADDASLTGELDER
ncbi:MAG TPA: Uma2 family endonuclease [Gemmatimonadaceae bacterium]|jgi:Uma2 family endonuclease